MAAVEVRFGRTEPSSSVAMLVRNVAKCSSLIMDVSSLSAAGGGPRRRQICPRLQQFGILTWRAAVGHDLVRSGITIAAECPNAVVYRTERTGLLHPFVGNESRRLQQ